LGLEGLSGIAGGSSFRRGYVTVRFSGVADCLIEAEVRACEAARVCACVVVVAVVAVTVAVSSCPGGLLL
jgi:hypothetical protein